jgi:hypothetical protein
MKVYRVEGIQNRIKVFEDELDSLDKIDSENYWMFVMSKLTGSVLPVTQSVSEAVVSIEGKTVTIPMKVLKTIKKSIDAYNNLQNDKGERALFDAAELSGYIEGDKTGNSAALLAQFFFKLKDENYSEAFKKALEAGVAVGTDAEKELLKPIIAGLNIGKSLKLGIENYKEAAGERSRMRGMIETRRKELEEKIRKEKNSLYHLTGGELGELNTGPKSPNVFTRIDELLEEINIKIQRVQNNIQI